MPEDLTEPRSAADPRPQKTSLEQEILTVLAQRATPLTGYAIGNQIENKWTTEGRRSRFLFWTFDPVIGFGTLYRALDKLKQQGLVTRIRTEQPAGIPTRFTWTISHDQ